MLLANGSNIMVRSNIMVQHSTNYLEIKGLNPATSLHLESYSPNFFSSQLTNVLTEVTVLVPGRPVKPCVLFVAMSRSLPWRGARCLKGILFWLGLALLTNILRDQEGLPRTNILTYFGIHDSYKDSWKNNQFQCSWPESVAQQQSRD